MRRRATGRMLAAGLALLLVPAWAPPLQAAPARSAPGDRAAQQEVDQVLQEVRQELAESSEALLLATADLRRAERALPEARRTLSRLQDRAAAARTAERLASRRRAVAQTRLVQASREVEDQADLVAEQRARIGRLARAAYQSGGSIGDVSALLEARDPADFAERLVSWQSVVAAQTAALEQLADAEAAFGAQEEGLVSVRDRLAVAAERAQSRYATVAELEAGARAAEATLSGLVAAEEAARSAAEAALAADREQLAALRGESDRLRASLQRQVVSTLGGTATPGGSTAPVQAGALTWPVRGRISSPFGMRVHPVTGVYKLHTGTDLAAPCGAAIRAARAGTVVAAGYDGAYGWRTVVSHGVVGGVLLTTTYNHQQDVRVRAGQPVGTGQVIGSVGSTGYSTGCHLHLELLVNSDFVDPLPWIR
jgi:murein DD-endopeptidase MepM/ murein hydrolase activator NlpD